MLIEWVIRCLFVSYWNGGLFWIVYRGDIVGVINNILLSQLITITIIIPVPTNQQTLTIHPPHHLILILIKTIIPNTIYQTNPIIHQLTTTQSQYPFLLYIIIIQPLYRNWWYLTLYYITSELFCLTHYHLLFHLICR